MASHQKQIVILGAGYGGLHTALRLARLLRHDGEWKILLIDRYDFHQLKTELHEVASARMAFDTVTIPLAKLLRVKNIAFLQAEVTHVDFALNAVSTTEAKIKYDKLVIALGSETEFFGIPGLSKNAFTLSSINDAELIKNHVHDLFAKAEAEANKSERRAMLTIVVGGGGFTGVELATELTDYVRHLCGAFRIPKDAPELLVIEAGETILGGFDRGLVSRAQQALKAKGIRLLLRTPCVSMEDDTIKLKTGKSIQARTVVWTGGVRACDLVAEAGLKYGPRSRVVVNPFLESVDHPGIYVIGDNALTLDPVTNRPIAPTAQLALQQADVAAINISAEIKGAKRVRYFPRVEGQFVSLGGHDAVGWVWKFKVTGLLAWLLKRLILVRYIYSVGGLRLVVPKLPKLFFR